MPVTSLAELRAVLRAATPGETIDLAPGEYRGPIVIDSSVKLRGQDRKTVLWRRGGPVILIRSPGVTLERLLIERTVQTQGPLIVHNAGCAPTGRDSMQLDTLISLGALVPGSTLNLPLEIETSTRTEIVAAGLYGAQIAPAVLEGDGKHLVWLTLDGKTIARGEIILGEIALHEGDKTRYLWLSGSVLDAPPKEGLFCLVSKKTRLHPSASGLMLEGTQLVALDSSGQAAPGRYAFIQRDPTGALSVYLPGQPPSPVLHNGKALAPLTRVLLHDKDTIKIGGLTLTVQPTDPLNFTLEPSPIVFADFDERFPDAVGLTLDNSKTAWKGRVISAAPWLDVTPTGDFRVPPSRSHTWTVQLNSEALALPNGQHESISGLLVVGSNAVIGVDVRINVRRPDVSLQAAPLDAGAVEWGWPVERSLSLSIGNLGRGTWTGTVRSNVPWLDVTTPMPLTCGPWSEIGVEAQFVPTWDNLTVGAHEIPDALILNGPDGDQPVEARLEVTPARGHLAAPEALMTFDEVERNAPLPDGLVQVHNQGAGAWSGTVTSPNGWVRLKPGAISLEPGATAEIEVSLLDVPADLALNTPVLLDEIRFEEAGTETTDAATDSARDAALVVGVQITIVERPPFLVASPVNFPPFVKGDNLPEGLLRIYNNGPARWRGSVVASVPWINVPDTTFVCEPDGSIEIYVTLNSQALDALKPGLSRWDSALSVTGGREPVTASVQVDLREAISEIHLDTPTLNFGQVDGASRELPSQMVRLVNASPAAWKGQVEVCVPWLSPPGAARTFDLDVPGQSVAEFAVVLNDAARWLPPGVTTEDRVLVITGQEQTMAIRAQFVLDEWAPLLALSPGKISLSGDTPQALTVRNTGSRSWTFQACPMPWLDARPRDFTLDPSQEQAIEVKRSGAVPGTSPAPLNDPRAIVIVGPGREFGVEVEVVETVEPPTDGRSD